ncbi:hypothetical protein Tco_1290753 [Tanacetum coccineum]
MYHDLYLGRKALVEKENMGLDLTKSDLCLSFVEDLTAKGMGLRVPDSHTGAASGLRPYHFTYPERKLTTEEMLYKFIDE